MRSPIYRIRVSVWLYPGETANWHFVTLPRTVSEIIKKKYGGLKRGWGSLPVKVTIGKTIWKTSIFPDSKLGSYVLPLKSEVRMKEKIRSGDTVAVSFRVGV